MDAIKRHRTTVTGIAVYDGTEHVNLERYSFKKKIKCITSFVAFLFVIL
jgi:hypothetical protein